MPDLCVACNIPLSVNLHAVARRDKRGRTYYKNVLANMTQWERPADYIDEDDVSQNAPASFLKERDGYSFSYTPTNSSIGNNVSDISGVAPPSYASVQSQRHLGFGGSPALGAPVANVIVRPRPSPPLTKRQQPYPTLSTGHAQSAYPAMDHSRPLRAQPQPQAQPVHATATAHVVGTPAASSVWKKAFDTYAPAPCKPSLWILQVAIANTFLVGLQKIRTSVLQEPKDKENSVGSPSRLCGVATCSCQ